MWDLGQGPFRPSADEFEDKLRQIFERLELPSDQIDEK
jgi:hypothetical protein